MVKLDTSMPPTLDLHGRRNDIKPGFSGIARGHLTLSSTDQDDVEF